MHIRNAQESELQDILALYSDARAYMRASGNRSQWVGGYPSEALVLADIRAGCSYVCEEDGKLIGVFSWLPGPDPTYAVIEGGAWTDDGPYTVIHRIAVGAHRKGAASACFAYALERSRSLRIDTHADNLPMQRALAKNGFTRCGVIHLENGDPRIAFQKTAP